MTVPRSENAQLVGCFSQMILFCWPASFDSGLQHALNGFKNAYDIVVIKISTSKPEILHLSRNPVQCSLQVGGVSLKHVKKFKYHGVAFMNYKMLDEEFDA